MVKTLKSIVQGSKIKVFGVLQKHQKMMPKRTPKMDKSPSKMEPWVPKE